MVVVTLLLLSPTLKVQAQCESQIIVSGPTTFCHGGSVTLTTSAAVSYIWSTGETTPSITVSSSGSYSVTVTDADGCSATSAATTVTVNPLPIVSVSPSGPATFCQGGSVILTSSPGSSYLWSTGETTPSITVSTSGSFSVTAADANGCSATSASVTVTVNPLPGVIAPASVCVGSTATLSPETGGTWTSSNTARATVTNTGVVTGLSSGSVTFTFTSTATGCSNITQAVIINTLPPVSAPASVCTGSTATLSPTTGGSWTSSNTARATVTNSGVITGISAGSVTFTFTNTTTGCSNTTSPVNVITAPAVNAPSAVCVGSSATLSPTTGGTWTSGNTGIASVTNSGVITGISAGNVTFTFTSTATGCSSTTSPVTVNALPAVTAPASVCIGSTATLSPATGGTWTSSNNARATVTNSGVITAVSAGNVTFTYINTATGCRMTTPVVTVYALPPVNSISGPSSVCSGNTITLTNSTGGGIWSSSNTNVATISNTGVVSGIAGGTVTVYYSVTNSNGCTRTVNRALTVNSTTVTITPAGPTTFCTGASVTLTASGANTYSWSPIDGLSITTGPTVIASPEVTTTYNVTGTGATGCTGTTQLTVTVNQRPEGIMSSDPAVCSGANSGTVSLTIADGSTVIGWETSTNGGTSWSPYTPSVNQYATTYENLTQTTVYRALLQLNGCQGYSSIGIIPVNNVLEPVVSISSTVSCLNTAILLHASGYGQPPFPIEDFQNANPAGWSGDDAGANNEDPNSNWALTNNGKSFNGRLYNSQAPPTNTKFFIITGITDEPDHNATMMAPPFSLVGTINPILSFYTALNFNAGTTGIVEISTDGGITFTPLITYAGPREYGNPNNGWVHVTYSLVSYVNQPDVRIRFNYTGTAGSNWGLDNIGIISTFQPISYHWTPLDHMTPSTGDTPDVTIIPDVGLHQYCVSSTTAAGCESDTVCVTVNVLPLPVCDVTGTDGPVCPSSPNIFSAPDGMSSYAWSITGNGRITAGANDRNVTVTAGSGCNLPFTISLTITDNNGCVSTCSKTVLVQDITPPVIICPVANPVFCETPAHTYTIQSLSDFSDSCFGTTIVTFRITGATDRNGSGNDASGRFNNGISTITWSVADQCGNISTCTTIVTVNPAPVTSPIYHR